MDGKLIIHHVLNHPKHSPHNPNNVRPLTPLTWSAREVIEKEVKARQQLDSKVERFFHSKATKREKRISGNINVWNRINETGRIPGNVRKLCMQGIPPSCREQAWKQAVGNPLGITQDVFAELAGPSRDEDEGKRLASNSIQLDVPRTFPDLVFFHCENDDLHDLLCAYALYDPSLGYIQGMSYIAAMLLIVIGDLYDAFVAFGNLLHSSHIYEEFVLQHHFLSTSLQDRFRGCFENTQAALFQHMVVRQGITVDLFLVEWMITFYAKSLPLNVATRVWDCMLHEQDCHTFLIRVGLGVLKLLGPVVIAKDDIGFTLRLLKNCPETIDEDVYMDSIFSVSWKSITV